MIEMLGCTLAFVIILGVLNSELVLEWQLGEEHNVEGTFLPQVFDLAALLQFIHEARGTIVDARTKEAYLNGHIPGAISFPSEEWVDVPRDKLRTLEGANQVVIYCDGTLCMSGAKAAQYLFRHGIRNIGIYRAGYQEWLRCGLRTIQSNSIGYGRGDR